MLERTLTDQRRLDAMPLARLLGLHEMGCQRHDGQDRAVIVASIAVSQILVDSLKSFCVAEQYCGH